MRTVQTRFRCELCSRQYHFICGYLRGCMVAMTNNRSVSLCWGCVEEAEDYPEMYAKIFTKLRSDSNLPSVSGIDRDLSSTPARRVVPNMPISDIGRDLRPTPSRRISSEGGSTRSDHIDQNKPSTSAMVGGGVIPKSSGALPKLSGAIPKSYVAGQNKPSTSGIRGHHHLSPSQHCNDVVKGYNKNMDGKNPWIEKNGSQPAADCNVIISNLMEQFELRRLNRNTNENAIVAGCYVPARNIGIENGQDNSDGETSVDFNILSLFVGEGDDEANVKLEQVKGDDESENERNVKVEQEDSDGEPDDKTNVKVEQEEIMVNDQDGYITAAEVENDNPDEEGIKVERAVEIDVFGENEHVALPAKEEGVIEISDDDDEVEFVAPVEMEEEWLEE